MPQFYFNVSDGRYSFEDQCGIALQRSEDVVAEAESLLRLLAYERRNHPVIKVLKALVQNVDGRNIYRGTVVVGRGKMLFSGRRL